jgi:hypothetical protein
LAPAGAAEADAESETQPDRPKPLSESLTGPALDAYKLAKILLEAKDAETAHGKFQEAFDRARDPRLLWNMAVSSKEARHYARSIGEIDRFLQEGGERYPELAVQARAARSVMENLVAPVRFRVTPVDAHVIVDGDSQPVAPGGSVLLDIGKHDVRVERSGFQPLGRTFTVENTRGLDIALVLEPNAPVIPVPPPAAPAAPAAPALPAAPAASVPVPTAPVAAPSTSTTSVVGWTFVGLGAVALVGGGVAHLASQSAASDFLARCNDKICDPSARPYYDDAESMATVATGLYVGGVASVVLGALLVSSGPPASGAQGKASVVVGLSSLSVKGTF